MSRELILKEVERRRRVFSRLWEYLAAIREAVRELDPDAEVYLFGSVARGEARPDSDVDVLVVSDRYGDEGGRRCFCGSRRGSALWECLRCMWCLGGLLRSGGGSSACWSGCS